MNKIGLMLLINGGSTSTKLSVRDGDKEIVGTSLRHNAEDLQLFVNIWDQYEYRKNAIEKWLTDSKIDIDSIKIIITRCGTVKPVKGGIYRITTPMINDMKSHQYGDHACSVCCSIAYDMAKELNIPVITADPPATDELCDEARYSGIKEISRISSFHALNQKSTARYVCEKLSLEYNSANLIVVHLGGGISVGAHHNGRVIDVNNALDGDGPFSPERAGGLPSGDLIRLCFDSGKTRAELLRTVCGNGGLMSYLGTKDVLEVEQRIQNGDLVALSVFKAMAYQVAKEIGAASAVLCGKVDVIVVTGSFSRSDLFMNYLRERVSFIAPIELHHGENEMEALADAGLRFLFGIQGTNTYPGENHDN